MELTSNRTLLWIHELRRILTAKDVSLKIYESQSAAYLRRLRPSEQDAWILLYPGKGALQWCERKKVRAVIYGTLPSGAILPWVDADSMAVTRHAVNRFKLAGHEHLALTIPKSDWYSNEVTRAGFLQQTGGNGRVIYHQGNAAHLGIIVEQLLDLTPRPTGWLIINPSFYLSICSHLQDLGVKIPQDVSLICRDSEPWQHFMRPRPTRYHFSPRKLAAAVARLVLRILHDPRQPCKPIRLMPEFVPWETLGEAP